MKTFTKTISSERDSFIENIQKEKSEKKEIRKETRKHIKNFILKNLALFLLVLAIGLLIYVIVGTINYSSTSTLIGEKKYKIVELHSNEDGDILYYSYVTKDKQIKSNQYHLYDFDEKLYSSNTDNSYIILEEWGHDGKVEKEKLIKLYVSEKMYADAYKKIENNE